MGVVDSGHSERNPTESPRWGTDTQYLTTITGRNLMRDLVANWQVFQMRFLTSYNALAYGGTD